MQIIQASYASELSKGFSQVTKAVLTSDAYRQIFPPIINPNVNRQKYWQTLSGGSYYQRRCFYRTRTRAFKETCPSR